jgi:hypothetical protein
LGTTGGAPGFAVFSDPIEQGAFEAYVMTEAFGLDPLVSQDFLPLSEELLVKAGLLYKVA